MESTTPTKDASGAEAPGTFARSSSGLVRQVGTGDTMLYGLMQLAVGYVVFTVAIWFAYPGASMPLATLIVAGGAIALGLVYALFSSVYPRSGGEYVFVSRTAHPALGFLVSWLVTFWEAFYFGVNGAFFAIFGLAPMFTVLGLQADSAALLDIGAFFAKDLGIFLAGTATVCFFTIVLVRGMRVYFRFQRIAAFVAIASALVTVLVLTLAATGAIDFRERFDDLVGAGAHQGIISEAAAEGTALAPGFSLASTLEFMIWPAFALLFAVLSVSFSGEIKNVRRGQLIGITGAICVGAALLIGLMASTQGAVGSEFLIASSAIDPDAFPGGLAPFVNLYASIAGGNFLLTILLNLWVLVFMVYVAGVCAVYGSRAMFAWSVDGVAPEKLSEVSPRSHAPTWAVLTTATIAMIFLTLFAFTDLLAILSGLLGFAVAFLIVSLIGTAFPFVRRRVFEGSPSAMRIAGLPVMSIAGLVASTFLAFIVYRAIVDDTFGANTATSLWINAVVLVTGLVWFFGARHLQRRRGVRVDERMSEIPVE